MADVNSLVRRYAGGFLLVTLLIAFACGSQATTRTNTISSATTPTDEPQSSVPFHPTASIIAADARAGVASTVTVDVAVPDRSFPRLLAIDIPKAWNISAWRNTPGETVGVLRSDLQIGLANGPCNVPVHAEFRLLSALPDGSTVSTAHQAHPGVPDVYADDNSNGLPDGVDRVPEFLTTFPLPGAPYARAYGQSNVSAFPVFIDLVTRDLGDDGFRMYFVLNDPNFHSNVVTATCSPLHTVLTLFGTSPGPQRGEALLHNPAAGDYRWQVRVAPPVDTDNDGIDNGLDNCMEVPNPGQADRDEDGLGDVCDPSPDENQHAGDEDGDGWLNRADNCPLESNAENVDANFNFIGDTCDPDQHGGYTGEEVLLSQPFTIDTQPVDPAQYASAPPELSSLPPVYDPSGLGGPGSPANPSEAHPDPNDAPKQDVGSTTSLDRNDCDNSWRAARSQNGHWSVCFPASWSYQQDRRGVAGTWEESFTLYKQGAVPTPVAGSTPRGSSTLGAITIHHEMILRGGAQVPECASPMTTTLAGIPAKVCRWPGATPALEGGTFGVAYYVDFGNGRLALEGIGYNDDESVTKEIETIFASLRLP